MFSRCSYPHQNGVIASVGAARGGPPAQGNMSPAVAAAVGRTRLGGGTPLLLLPGLCCTGRLWQRQIQALAAAGGGGAASSSSSESEVFVGDPHWSGCLKRTAAALLELLPDGPVSVVGHSLGGYLAMELVRQAPEGRIARLGLVSTQARADTPAISARRRALIAAVHADGPLAGVSAPSILLGSSGRAQCGGSTDDRGLWGLVEEMATEVGGDGFERGCMAAMGRPDSRPTLRSLPATLPTLLLVGNDDAVTPLAATREMAKLLGGGGRDGGGRTGLQVEVVKGCGHMAREWITLCLFCRSLACIYII